MTSGTCERANRAQVSTWPWCGAWEVGSSSRPRTFDGCVDPWKSRWSSGRPGRRRPVWTVTDRVASACGTALHPRCHAAFRATAAVSGVAEEWPITSPSVIGGPRMPAAQPQRAMVGLRKPAAQKQLVVEGPRKPRRKTVGGRRLECRIEVHSSAAWLTRVLVPADDVRDAQGLPSRPEGLGLPRRLEEFELRETITNLKSLTDVI